MEANYQKVVEIIKGNETFLISSHAHPDGDGLGSTLALGLALESLGKKVVMYNEDRVPRILDFMSGSEKIVNHLDKADKFDVSFLVDCGQPERAGKDFPSKDRRGKLICVDHHVSGSEEADVACLDDGAASTGEVVYKILKDLGIDITSDIATLILTTIIVDTGFFRYSNTTSHALDLASDLVAKGASTWHISQNLEERVPPEQLVLLTSVVQTIDYLLDGKLAIVVLTSQMLRQAKAHVEMAEEFINYPRSVEGVEVATLIRELEHNKYKISFRSKGTIDVAALASKFGGGGHKHAAGCTIEAKLGIVKETIIGAVSDILRGG